MAEGPDPVVADLEQEVTCGICHDHYQEPKLFPCYHYYCKQCILTLSSRYRPNEPFPCPDCREPTLLPDNNPDKLPTAFFINRMKEIHSRMEKLHSKLEVTCEMCSRGKVTAFCRQCVDFICDKCVELHQYIKVFAGHKISTLEELKQGGVKELVFNDLPPPKCDDHDEPKKIFCSDCKKLICRDCVVIDHAGHNYEFVKKAAPATRKNLTEHLSSLKNLLPGLTTSMDQVKETKKQIQAQKTLTEKNVNDKFKELHDILEQCKVRVLREYSALVDKKIDKLAIEEKGLSTTQNLIDFINRALNNASDEELVTMEEQVVSQINAEVVKRGKEAVGAHPTENACFGVDVFVAEDLKTLCENNVRVYPSVCGDGIKMAEVGSCARFSIFIGSNKRRPQAILKSLVDGSSEQLQVAPARAGVCNVQYTPKIRSQHHLLISVEDHPVPGSPFSVLVKLHPTKLDKPVRKIEGINPYYGVVNSSGELVVTDEDVVMFNKKGEKIRSISKLKYGFKGAKGVAVDKNDNIYVSDSNNRRVYKLNKEGDLLKKFGKKGSGPEEFEYPRGIAVAGDRVLVCDSHKKRVRVLTTELEPVNVIEGLSGPCDIAVDDKQMYIADNDRGIKVFTMDGKFIHRFEHEKVLSAYGVCVDGDTGFVYVINHDYHSENCVCVFTRDGQFVTSFGNGHICSSKAFGVTVDKDGFVYVFDCNHGVIVF